MYEMPIRSFTADPSSGVGEGLQGTFAGAAAKVGPALIEYLMQSCCGEGPRQGVSAGALPRGCAVQGLSGGQQAGGVCLRNCRSGSSPAAVEGSSSCTAAPPRCQPEQHVHPASLKALLCKCTSGFTSRCTSGKWPRHSCPSVPHPGWYMPPATQDLGSERPPCRSLT